MVSAVVSWYNLQLLVNFAPQTVCFLSVYSSAPSKFKPIKTNLTPLDTFNFKGMIYPILLRLLLQCDWCQPLLEPLMCVSWQLQSQWSITFHIITNLWLILHTTVNLAYWWWRSNKKEWSSHCIKSRYWWSRACVFVTGCFKFLVIKALISSTAASTFHPSLVTPDGWSIT